MIAAPKVAVPEAKRRFRPLGLKFSSALVRWALWAAVSSLLAGCAAKFRPGGLFRPGPCPTVEEIVAHLGQRSRPVRTLWLRGRVSMWQRGYPGRRHFEATILADVQQRRVRLRAYRNYTILIFEILADDWGLRFRDAVENRYYAASYERLRLAGSPWAGISPRLLIQALLVEQSVAENALQAEKATVRRRWGWLRMRLETSKARVRIRLDRAGDRILRMRYEPASDAGTVELRYGEMIEVEGVRLPRWAEIDYRPTHTRLRLDAWEYKVDRRFAPEVFMLNPPEGQGWLALEGLR